jgi:A118 family predicted phage portal protein
MSVPGVLPEVDTGSITPTFGIVKPAMPNTRVDFSPYGQSIFADAIDAVQSVDLCYDAMIAEIDSGKMRVFLSDVMFDQQKDDDGRRIPIPFGKGDCTVFRKVMSTEDTISEFAPALRTDSQVQAFRLALQILGDLCGLGTNYFDLDNVGYVKTATEVSSDNSALMRNIRKNENGLQGALTGVARAAMACARSMGAHIPDEGDMRVIWDDSIIQDTGSEKQLDMQEVAAGLMRPEEYRSKWYGDAGIHEAGRSGAGGAEAGDPGQTAGARG